MVWAYNLSPKSLHFPSPYFNWVHRNQQNIYIHYIHNIGIGSILNLLCKLFFWLLITANNLSFKIYYKSKTFKIYYKSESFVKIRE